MKLFDSMGPNPHVVRMFAAEKGVTLETEKVDLMGGENRQSAYLARNPAGQLPCLQLDNGEYLAEITAICEYLDEIGPGPSLIGATPEERALTRMWVRRVDLNIAEPLANGFRYAEGLPLFKSRMITIPEAAEGLKRIAREKLAWLDGLMAGRQFIGGDRLTLADVLLYCMLAFGRNVGQPFDENLPNIKPWFDRMAARPSASA
ncbi:MAG: glutathione S-transferase family protein [Pseudomonadales bacterium]|nr:glutathione S-transferase family protein [Pseudomonadales bacterium]MCP5183234.1 glutathione S-transferase family protein [Pseudomonadales bacterium]